MADVDVMYAEAIITVRPGDRLHGLLAILCDTWIDDLTSDRIAELEALAASWRWTNAAGRRLDQAHGAA